MDGGVGLVGLFYWRSGVGRLGCLFRRGLVIAMEKVRR